MKTFLTICFVLFMCIISGCSGNEEEAPNLNPEAVAISLDTIRWSWAKISWSNAKDPENEPVYYKVTLNDIVKANVTAATELKLIDLEAETDYEVEVEAIDLHGGASTSSLDFTTGVQPTIEITAISVEDITSNSARLIWQTTTEPTNLKIFQFLSLDNELLSENYTGNEFLFTNLNSFTKYSVSLSIIDDSGVVTAVNIPFTTL